jgi:hypothetical protein
VFQVTPAELEDIPKIKKALVNLKQALRRN